MFDKENRHAGLGWLLAVQFVAVFFMAFVVVIWHGLEIAQIISVFYGGLPSILGSAVLAWRIRRSTEAVIKGKSHAAVHLYLGAIERLLYTVALFGIGIIVLKLEVLAMLLGLIAGQIGFFLGGLRSRI